MKIYVSPNLVIPGYEGLSFIEFAKDQVTLADVFSELSALNKNRIKFIRSEGYVSRDDFLIKINGNEIKGEKSELEKELHDGDTVTVLFETLGG